MAERPRPGGSARRRKLTPVGSGMLRGLYEPKMRMPEPTISALASFDRLPSREAIADAFEQHIWPLQRFSSIVTPSGFEPVDGPMDRAYHITERNFAKDTEFDQYVQSIMVTPLDHAHPLWQIIVLRAEQGHAALLVRVHHTVGDGLGLLFAFIPMLQCEGGDVLSKIPLPAFLLGKSGQKSGQRRPASSQKKGNWFTRCLTSVGMFIRGVLSLLLMKPDSALTINAPLAERTPYLAFSGRHVYTRMPEVPTSAIKAVRATHGCTFNDAIMAALSGAFRRYCAEDLKDPLVLKGGPLECKGFMLLALPRKIDLQDPGVSLLNNILTPVFHLPIDDPTPAGRLRRAVTMCGNLKSLAYVTGINLTTKFITAVAPTGVMRGVASNAISSATCNITNLPLPEVPMTLLGEEVKDIQVIFVNNIPQISMLSYNGALRWNMVSDPALIPDPVAFGRHFVAEFQELARA